MPVHWHRRDLRPTDNVGLAAAAAGDVVPLFVLDEAVLEHAGPPRVAFLLDALAALRQWYRDRGSDLLVRRGDPREVVPAVAAEHDAGLLTWNRDYSGLARERDAAVRRALDDRGIDRSAHHDAVCHAPGSITTTKGERYDPDAEYVRAYVPELRGVDAATIHEWPELSSAERASVAPDYPEPIVDHAERREAGIAAFERARDE